MFISSISFYNGNSVIQSISTRVNTIEIEKNDGDGEFLIRFEVEVWNSYSSPQKVLTSNNCGIQIQPEAQGTIVTYNFSRFDQGCAIKSSGYDDVFISGRSAYDENYLIKFDNYFSDIFPDGNFSFSYNEGITDLTKIKHILKSTITSLNGTLLLTQEALSTEWGLSNSHEDSLPIDLFSIIGFISVISASTAIRKIKNKNKS